MLVEIETDNGLIGWGECYGPARMTAAVVDGVAPWLIGEDPLRTDLLWQTIYARLRDHGQKGVVIQGLSGIDIALWDIKGKHFGVPVHGLMGGPLRTEVQAYATGPYRRRSGDPLPYLVEEAAGYVAEGFRGREAEGRLRRRGGRRADARRARGDRRRIRADGRRQPRLRRGGGDPARPADRATATSAGSRSRWRRRTSPATAR